MAGTLDVLFTGPSLCRRRAGSDRISLSILHVKIMPIAAGVKAVLMTDEVPASRPHGRLELIENVATLRIERHVSFDQLALDTIPRNRMLELVPVEGKQFFILPLR
jgi:hypothetical protein